MLLQSSLRILPGTQRCWAQCRSSASRIVVRACSTALAPPAPSEAKTTASSEKPQLRWYQSEGMEEVLKRFREGVPRQLIAMPTGAGKTVTFAHITRQINQPTLVLVNREELIWQTLDTFQRVCPELDVQILHKNKNKPGRDVTVMTVQTAVRRLELLVPLNFKLLVVDEAHHSTAESYLAIFNTLGFMDESPGGKAEAGQSPSPINSMPSHTTGPSGLPAAASADTGSTAGEGQVSLPTTAHTDTSSMATTAESTDQAAAGSPSQPEGSEASPPSKPKRRGRPPKNQDAASTGSPQAASSSSPSIAGTQACGQCSESAPLDKDAEAVSRHARSEFAGRKLMLGVTATPYRADEDDLMDVYVLTYQTPELILRLVSLHRNVPPACGGMSQVEVKELIEQGHLCKVKGRRVLTHADISEAADAGSDTEEDAEGDFNNRELSKVVNSRDRNLLVADTYLKYAKGRKTIAFCCDMKHADDLAAVFREKGVTCASLTGNSTDRKELLAKHKAGQIEVLTNVQILTEGYDDRSVSCILMARPTKSTGFYVQCVGRGLRTFPGKDDCLILDFTDRVHRLDMPPGQVTAKDIVGLMSGMEGYVPPLAERREPEILEILGGGSMELFDAQELAWVRHGGDYWLCLWTGAEGTAWVHLKQLASNTKGTLNYELRVARGPSDAPAFGKDQASRWQVAPINPTRSIAKLILHAERALRKNKWHGAAISKHMLAFPKLTSPSRTQPASAKQLQLIRDLGMDHDRLDAATVTKGQASDLITLGKVEKALSDIKSQAPPRPATEPQKRLLRLKLAQLGSYEDVRQKLARAHLAPIAAPGGVDSATCAQASETISLLLAHEREMTGSRLRFFYSRERSS